MPVVNPVQLLRSVGRFEDVLVSRVDPHVIFQRHCHRRIGLVRVLAGHVEKLHTRAQRVRHQNGRPSPCALRLDADRATVALVRTSQRQVDPVAFGVEDLAGPIRKGSRPRIERAELIALSVPDSQVDQAPANIPNRHIRVSAGERLSDHCGQILVPQNVVAVNCVDLFAFRREGFPVDFVEPSDLNLIDLLKRGIEAQSRCDDQNRRHTCEALHGEFSRKWHPSTRQSNGAAKCPEAVVPGRANAYVSPRHQPTPSLVLGLALMCRFLS